MERKKKREGGKKGNSQITTLNERPLSPGGGRGDKELAPGRSKKERTRKLLLSAQRPREKA